MPEYTYHDIAKMIDHSLLRPGTTDGDLEAGIDVALHFDVASVCIQPHYLRRLTARLKGSTVRTSTVVGFPHGAHTQAVKLHEAQVALDDGCEELDLVVNTGKVRSGDYAYVHDEVAAIVDLAHDAGQKVKLIFETALLETDQKIALCRLCGDLSVDWAKTSTGFSDHGAVPEDIILLRAHCPDSVQIKASGGIRTLDELLQMRELGATRVGASNTANILTELHALRK